MIKWLLVCSSILFHGVVLSDKKILPSYLKICKQSDPYMNDCIKTSIEALKSHMEKEIPEMRIPAFNPFHFIEIGYDTGSVKFDFRNTDLGLANQFDIKDVKMDVEGCTYSMDIFFPLLLLSGDYKLVGKLSVLTLDGEGSFTGNVTSTQMSFVLYCSHESKAGEDYMKFKDVTMKLKIEDVKLQLNDLFKNNKQLTDTTNAAINENSKILASDFETFLAKGIGETLLRVCQTVFDRFPLDMLLPK